MPYGLDEANRRIDVALASGATELDLTRLHLTVVPPRLALLSNLTKLRLDDNYLRELPDWLAAFPLVELRLGSNRLRRLPDPLATLTSLTRLDLGGNCLVELPRWIADLGLTELFLDGNCFGELPEWLGTMTEFTALSIGDRQLVVTPDWVVNLTKLTRLDLDHNRLAELPAWLGDLTNLAELYLNNNRLTELPRYIANFGLRVLYVDDNRFVGLPEWLGTMTDLVEFGIGSSGLTAVPNWAANLVKVTRLDMEDNRLTEIPDWIAGLAKLTELRLHNNRLTALPLLSAKLTTLRLDNNRLTALPEWLGNITSLTHLGIDSCGLTTVPNWIRNLTNLERLQLGDNRLTELPDWLADLTDLNTLWINGNRLTELPPRLAELVNLEQFYVDNNLLNGLPDWLGGMVDLAGLGIGGCRLTELPDWLSTFTDLTDLRINDNLLREVPGWLPNLTNVTTLWLHSNQITELPDGMSNLSSLSTLWVSHNQLSDLPEWIGDLAELTALGIEGCQLQTLPGWLRNLRRLTDLSASHNQISELPEWLTELTNLSRLWITDNQIAELPAWVGDLTCLTSLDVNNNRLRELPTRLADIGSLTKLSVSDNQLDRLPEWLSGMTGLTELEIGGCRLSQLPAWLASLTRLSQLDCNNNELTELPGWLTDLSALTHLSLNKNPLGSIEIDLGRLAELKVLDLGDCNLRALPDSLGRLVELTDLRLGDNSLTELPAWLAELPVLRRLSVYQNELAALPGQIGRLTNLTSLYAFSNQLTELPDSVGDLASLETLQLDGNKLRSLPSEIGRLTNLVELYLGNNELAALPEDIGRLPLLSSLDVAGNRLESLPANIIRLTRLTRLEVADNELRALPDSLVELPCLEALSVIGNPLVSPPPEIVAGGSQSVLAFIRDRMRGSDAQWLSKLLVVGEGGVGKTSLVKALARDSHDPDEPSTHGLMIRDLLLDHPVKQEVRMRLSTWDFGGQQIYHATHQFFLTNRSLFLMLWNSRLGWEQGKLHYWLDIITARAPESPIVLVATHIGGRPVDLPLAELQAKYPRIVAGVQVDNATREGMSGLRTILAEQAAQLPLMGSEWPTNWLAAADALRTMPENHITPARMWETMAAAGVTNSRLQTFIARALHELGDILYYSDDPELNQIVVLRPAWVNDYISRVLDSGEVADRRGLLTREHLDSLWRDLDRGVRDHFLGMMDRYDLSYRIDEFRTGDLSLVVERLQWDPPAYQQEWEALRQRPDSREIKVIYQLNTMPPGIPTWFIARSHRFSKNIHWRTGALLGHGDGQHLALVKADRHRSMVELAVRGPSPVGFFMVLDDGLNLTLERFPGLHINRQVPCPCDETCHELFDYDNLRARLARTPPRYEIECHRSGELVSVPELLLGLAPSERDATRISIDQFAKTLEQFGDRLDEQSDYSQRMFLRLQRLAQQQQEARCPSVFVIVPADRRRITGSAYEIHLYCEEPGAWHRLPGSQGVYPITQPKEWLVKLGPYVQHLITVLKHAAPLAGPILGVAVGVLHEQIKSDCDLMKELAGQLPKEIRHDRETPDGVPVGGGPDTHATTDADFRALKAMLTKLDPTQAWGGLSRFTTPEGLTLYLCQQHLAQYRPPTSGYRRVADSGSTRSEER